jgi:hypothetical protein
MWRRQTDELPWCRGTPLEPRMKVGFKFVELWATDYSRFTARALVCSMRPVNRMNASTGVHSWCVPSFAGENLDNGRDRRWSPYWSLDQVDTRLDPRRVNVPVTRWGSPAPQHKVIDIDMDTRRYSNSIEISTKLRNIWKVGNEGVVFYRD